MKNWLKYYIYLKNKYKGYLFLSSSSSDELEEKEEEFLSAFEEPSKRECFSESEDIEFELLLFSSELLF